MTSTTSAPALAPRRPRRRPRLVGVVAAAIAIAVGSYALTLVRTAPTSPPRPAAQAPLTTTGSGTSVDPRAAAPAAPGDAAGAYAADGSIAQIDHSIAAWTKNLAANSHDYISATNLALLYHGRGRLSADLGDQEKALAAAKTALAIDPTDTAARALEATILYTIHDFSGAFAAADGIYRADPTQLGALATRFDAELELGRIADARADLATLGSTTLGRRHRHPGRPAGVSHRPCRSGPSAGAQRPSPR